MLSTLSRGSCCSYTFSTRTFRLLRPQRDLHACIVGSGPAGFYSAQHLLKKGPDDLHVDILDRLPAPFGLVRYGVAPHHQDVKNAINGFSDLARTERCAFLGNINVGVDVSLQELRQIYDVVVMAYGAGADRRLNIPGEDLQNVHSAREFVGWYNGLPENRDLSVDLSKESAVIFGLGNVALDVAMMLLSPISFLKETDISEHALEQLRHSSIKKVYLVGRRGPMEVAFTIKECKELIRIPGCSPGLRREDFQPFDDEALLNSLPRPRKRLMKLLCQTSQSLHEGRDIDRFSSASTRNWEMLFRRSPVEVVPDSTGNEVAGVKLEINDVVNGKAVPTGQLETLPCGLVFRSVGYRGSSLDKASDKLLEFDESRGVIPNEGGRTSCPGVYCSGWIKHGPSGTIVDTLNDARETSATILQDLPSLERKSYVSPRGATLTLQDHMTVKGVQVVSFDDWQAMDRIEVQRGQVIGKPREKITSVEEMLQIAREQR